MTEIIIITLIVITIVLLLNRNARIEIFIKILIVMIIALILKTTISTSKKEDSKIKSGGKKDSDDKIFYLSNKDVGYLTRNFRKVLVENGWIDYEKLDEASRRNFNNNMKNDILENTIDLVYGILGHNLIYTKKAKIKNFIGKVKRCIADKCTLAKNINEYNVDISEKYGKVLASAADDVRFIKDHFCKTSFLYDNEEVEFGEGEIKIIRPCGTGFQSGRGIFIVTNKEELEEIKQVYPKEDILGKKDAPSEKGLCTGENNILCKDELAGIIISDYIKDTMTFAGLKMHLRMYMLIVLEPILSYKLFDDAKVLTANLKYRKSNFSERHIHDTHEGSTKEFFTFRADWPRMIKGGCKPVTEEDRDNIFKQCDTLCALLFNIFKKAADEDPESKFYNKNENKFAFEVFGLDVMIDENCNIFLIEVNDKVGYDYTGKQDKNNLEKFDKFIYNYYNNLYQSAIKPLEEYL